MKMYQYYVLLKFFTYVDTITMHYYYCTKSQNRMRRLMKVKNATGLIITTCTAATKFALAHKPNDTIIKVQ